jgi:hypothetical protein
MANAAAKLITKGLGVQVVAQGGRDEVDPGTGISIDEDLAVAGDTVAEQRCGPVDDHDVDFATTQGFRGCVDQLEANLVGGRAVKSGLEYDREVDIGERTGTSAGVGSEEEGGGDRISVEGLRQARQVGWVKLRNAGPLVDNRHRDDLRAARNRVSGLSSMSVIPPV